MTIIYPINGKNERLGNLFKTPKHLLLYKGVPAIVASVNYMKSLFPDAEIVILANARYYAELADLVIDANVWEVVDTESQVETLRHFTTREVVQGSVMFVDCDIVPISTNRKYCLPVRK
jgi:2-C-methyl-D-erythritol 4-phosphate cytidylyltransferase